MDSLSTLLRARRATEDHTQEQAAVAMGVSRNSFASWEKGAMFPSVQRVGAVATYLRMSELELERLRP